ncbi:MULTISPECIES: DUF6957 family protein [Pseudomonas]|mgnify:FL=1|uniref:DUF6957 family protein n=1 Tax=Pseudomonas TaxID=286 RepID=UPI000677AB0C|nr:MULTISPECIES: hypothetical protein [Pseudomonas]SST10762.1 Uncharacterised protein [Acinetobacter baumannii]ARN47001.1 hypothetical protein A6752_15145 [Pseudomonas aeruginosa]EIU4992616.1 hypothetical protein [Pseudomonas aeruginosa]EIY2610038.1 hypothetical protein [Pseudomonas aeruginosa]EIY2742488.1 hypothetical protein [Pseudomonas aeruginosa]
MDELSAVTDLLYGRGTPMSGLSLTDEEAMAMVRQRFPFNEFCLVRDWLWLDLAVTPAEREQLSNTGRQPVLVYAHTVVYDSARRWDAGDFVRTSPLHVLHGEGLFQTWSTLYVLLGEG